MRQYAEKYSKDGLVVVAINLSDKPQQVYDALVQRQIDPRQVPVLLGGANVQRAFGIDGPHHTFLIDQRGVIRAHQHGGLGDRRFDQKIDIVLGKTPPEFGWRRNVAATYQKAIEDADAGRLDQALGGLKSIAPPSVMMIKVEVGSLPPQYVRPCLQAAQAGVQQWQRTIGKLVQFQFVSDEEKKEGENKDKDKKEDKKEEKKEEKKPEDKRPDLIIKFATQVFDPNDNTGLGTVCAHTRVMNEGEMGMRPASGDDRKPQHALAMIGVGHASSGALHTPQALVHLVQMSIAYALGLDHREDDDSITKVGVDDNTPTLSPSPEDYMVLSNLLINVHYQMGSVYLKQKKFKEAEEEFKIVLAVNPREPRANEGLKQARQQQLAAGTGEKK